MKKIFITTTALLIACTLSAADLFVSPEGNDRNPGTKDSPKATLTAALRQARELRRLNDESVKGGITIHLEAGDYHLYEPVFIRPEDSGTEASPTVITSDGNAVLNGGVEIRNWKKQGKLWVADVPMFNGRPLDSGNCGSWTKAVRARDVADFEKMYRIINNDPQNEILWVPAAAVKKIQKPDMPKWSFMKCGVWQISVSSRSKYRETVPPCVSIILKAASSSSTRGRVLW